MALTTYEKMLVFSKEIQVLYHMAGQLNSLITFFDLSRLVPNNCCYKAAEAKHDHPRETGM